MTRGRPLRTMGEPDDRMLVEAAQRDPRQIAGLYEAHVDRVYAYVLRRVRDRAEAEDITSAVFQQALANIKRFEWRGAPVAAWLFRIAANEIRDRYARLEKERNTPLPQPAPEPRPDEVEERARVLRAVHDLPDDQRRVLELRFLEGRSITEIAAELKRSEGAVKQLQFRGVANLRHRLGEDHG